MTVIARELTADAFLPFGRVLDLTGVPGSAVTPTSGDGWRDCFTNAPLIDGPGHLGMTHGPGAPWSCTRMERHPRTQEATFCASAPIVLAVAPAGPEPAPRAETLRAFIIRPGQIAVLDRNVWHDACRGLEGPTPYYWMAICGLGPNPWIPVEDGPVEIRA